MEGARPMTNFIDTATIEVSGGKGGDGMVAYRREKYVPDGGPAGGDGGKGGNVILKVDEGMSTLVDFSYKRHFKAQAGENGMPKSMHGRGGKDLIVFVPAGTIVKRSDTGEIVGDLITDGQEIIVAHGGRGGRGNKRFATNRNPAPEIAENGELGDYFVLDLELSVLADVGLVGFPSVGKSTLLSVVSAAKPKIADYPFTTLAPNVGVVTVDHDNVFVMADIPGLIEGASEGVGLGIEFLKHIQRTRVLLHLIDMGGYNERDPYNDFKTINAELDKFGANLLDKPQLLVATKMDMPEAADNLALFKMEYQEEYGKAADIFEVSNLTKAGVTELLRATAEAVKAAPEPKQFVEEESDVTYTLEEEDETPFTISRDSDGTWLVNSEKIQKLLQRTNFEYEEGTRRFSRQLKRMGLDEALRAKGAKNGDDVLLGDYIFEFSD